MGLERFIEFKILFNEVEQLGFSSTEVIIDALQNHKKVAKHGYVWDILEIKQMLNREGGPGD